MPKESIEGRSTGVWVAMASASTNARSQGEKKTVGNASSVVTPSNGRGTSQTYSSPTVAMPPPEWLAIFAKFAEMLPPGYRWATEAAI